MKLSRANQQWHDHLDQCYQAFLETLTALDLASAQAHWQSFKDSLLAHIDFEHQYIETLAAPLENNIQQLMKADHLILKRLIPKIDQTISDIENARSARAVLVERLDGLIKMRNVLSHHDEREKKYLYAILDEQLSKETAQSLAQQMTTAHEAL